MVQNSSAIPVRADDLYIIPSKDHINDLDLCVSSLEEKTTWKNFEIIIVENNSVEKEDICILRNAEKQIAKVQDSYVEKGIQLLSNQ